MTFTLEIKTSEELASEINEVKASSVRSERDKLLAETDWVVVKSQELGESIPDHWVTYRQSLRDVTKQEGFPSNVSWPEKPE